MIEQLGENFVFLTKTQSADINFVGAIWPYLQRPCQAIDHLVRSNMAIGVNVQAMRLVSEGLCYLDVLGCSFVLDGSGISRSPFALHPFRARTVRGYGWQCGIVRMRLSFQESRRPYSRHGRNRHGRQLMSHGSGCGRRHCGHCRLDGLEGARKMYAICQQHILDGSMSKPSKADVQKARQTRLLKCFNHGASCATEQLWGTISSWHICKPQPYPPAWHVPVCYCVWTSPKTLTPARVYGVFTFRRNVHGRRIYSDIMICLDQLRYIQRTPPSVTANGEIYFPVRSIRIPT
jgi:hypothetical protein